MLIVFYQKITSDVEGDKLTACVAVAIGNELGCVVENNGINKDSEKIKAETLEMVKYMMNKRNVINETIIEEAHHTVEEIGSAIASVIYLKDEIIA